MYNTDSSITIAITQTDASIEIRIYSISFGSVSGTPDVRFIWWFRFSTYFCQNEQHENDTFEAVARALH